MDPILHFDNGRYVGRTTFSPAMLRTAIASAVTRVEGVASMRCDLGFRFRNMFRPAVRRCGVMIRSVGIGSVIVEVCIVAKQGYLANDLSYRIQEAILGIVANKDITDKKIKRVDVRITDVERTKKPPKPKRIKEAA